MSTRDTGSTRALHLVADVVWRGSIAKEVDDATLDAALGIARSNLVEGMLARAYPERLSQEVRRVAEGNDAFVQNLQEAVDRLAAEGVVPVLIKADLSLDHAYSNFDLVVGDDGWEASHRALLAWGTADTYWLEPGKTLIKPPRGPAAHLHRSVEWFGIPIVDTQRLRAGARHSDGPWLTPSSADEVRILLAHCVFQNLHTDLSELLSVRRFDDSVFAEAKTAADAEGWGRGFREAADSIHAAMARLDHGIPQCLPVPLGLWPCVWTGFEHAGSLLKTKRLGAAVRESVLRLPLVAAKRRRKSTIR